MRGGLCKHAAQGHALLYRSVLHVQCSRRKPGDAGVATGKKRAAADIELVDERAQAKSSMASELASSKLLYSKASCPLYSCPAGLRSNLSMQVWHQTRSVLQLIRNLWMRRLRPRSSRPQSWRPTKQPRLSGPPYSCPAALRRKRPMAAELSALVVGLRDFCISAFMCDALYDARSVQGVGEAQSW